MHGPPISPIRLLELLLGFSTGSLAGPVPRNGERQDPLVRAPPLYQRHARMFHRQIQSDWVRRARPTYRESAPPVPTRDSHVAGPFAIRGHRTPNAWKSDRRPWRPSSTVLVAKGVSGSRKRCSTTQRGTQAASRRLSPAKGFTDRKPRPGLGGGFCSVELNQVQENWPLRVGAWRQPGAIRRHASNEPMVEPKSVCRADVGGYPPPLGDRSRSDPRPSRKSTAARPLAELERTRRFERDRQHRRPAGRGTRPQPGPSSACRCRCCCLTATRAICSKPRGTGQGPR